jgi:UPF0755 protein
MMRRILIVLVSLGIVAAAVAFGARSWLDSYLDTPLVLEESRILDVPAGSSLKGIARDLAGEGVLKHPAVLTAWARHTGDAAKIRAGEYELTTDTTAQGLIDLLVRGQAVLHSLTFVEGWTFTQMQAALDAHPALERTGIGSDAERLMTELGMPAMAPEGWFLPETYRFSRGTRDLVILRQAFEAMQEALEQTWNNRDDDLPLESPYEALILASIVERETGLDAERAKVAGVFVRRLRKGMRLQTDPTVIYGLGEDFDGDLKRADLRRDTPWNTYTRAGLPPTPIAMPGLASLEAAVKPAEGTALYFVATGKGDGSHQFSDTLEEHNRAVAAYLRRLRQGGR